MNIILPDLQDPFLMCMQLASVLKIPAIQYQIQQKPEDGKQKHKEKSRDIYMKCDDVIREKRKLIKSCYVLSAPFARQRYVIKLSKYA